MFFIGAVLMSLPEILAEFKVLKWNRNFKKFSNRG